MCKNHPSAPAAAKCNACGASICRDCIREIGYFCSAECREQLQASPSQAPADGEMPSAEEIAAKTRLIGKIVKLALLFGAVAVALYFVVPIFFAAEAVALWTYGDGTTAMADPVLAGGVIVFSTPKAVVGLDPSTGETRWEKPVGRGGTVVAEGDKVLVRTDTQLRVLSAATGAELMKATASGAEGRVFFAGRDALAIADGGRLAATSGAAENPSIRLVAIKGGTELTRIELPGVTEISCAGCREGLFVISGTGGGPVELRFLDSRGNEKWRAPLAGFAGARGVKVVPAGKGAIAWDASGFTLAAKSGARSIPVAGIGSVVVGEGVAVLTAVGTIEGYSIPGGQKLWGKKVDYVEGEPLLVGGKVLVGMRGGWKDPGDVKPSPLPVAQEALKLQKGFSMEGKGKVLCVDAISGEVLWEAQPGGRLLRRGDEVVVFSSKAVVRLLESGDDLFGADRRLTGLRMSDGKLRWGYQCPKGTAKAFAAGGVVILSEVEARMLDVVNVKFTAVGVE